MKKTIMMAAVLLAAFQMTAGQRTVDENEAAKARQEVFRELRRELPTKTDTASVTADEVGEPDSFGKNVKFIGIASSGFAIAYTSCNPAILLSDLGITLGPDDRCLVVVNPAVTTTAIFTDMARITIPARTVSDVFYTINNHSISWDYANDGIANIFGQMSYSPRITIESVALNDPAAIDPSTGLPMNGSFTTTGNGTKFQSKLLVPGVFESSLDSYTRANTTGFSRQFFRDLGLSETIINRLYRNPITIRLGMRLSLRGVPAAQFVYTSRFLGV